MAAGRTVSVAARGAWAGMAASWQSTVLNVPTRRPHRPLRPPPKPKRKTMNHQFDDLTKGLDQAVTRCAALKKVGVGLAGMALACFGLTSKAAAITRRGYCQIVQPSWFGNAYYSGACV